MAVKGPVLWLLETALDPDQPPEAVQDVALLVDQVRLEAPDGATDVSDAVKLITGVRPATVAYFEI